jgi:hypothetical protein
VNVWGKSPLLWRHVLAHSDTTLAPLHMILQILVAWSDEHLPRFYIHGKEYGSSGAQTRLAVAQLLGVQRHTIGHRLAGYAAGGLDTSYLAQFSGGRSLWYFS